jgi:hypothetical protein
MLNNTYKIKCKKKTRPINQEQEKRETYGVESTSRAGGAREAPGVRLSSLAL